MTRKRQIRRITKGENESKNIEREIRRAIGLVDSYKRKYPDEYDEVISKIQAKESLPVAS